MITAGGTGKSAAGGTKTNRETSKAAPGLKTGAEYNKKAPLRGL